MKRWLLRVQVCGEWEECSFGTRQEALTAFVALAADYTAQIERAILLRNPESEAFAVPPEAVNLRHEYIN